MGPSPEASQGPPAPLQSARLAQPSSLGVTAGSGRLLVPLSSCLCLSKPEVCPPQTRCSSLLLGARGLSRCRANNHFGGSPEVPIFLSSLHLVDLLRGPGSPSHWTAGRRGHRGPDPGSRGSATVSPEGHRVDGAPFSRPTPEGRQGSSWGLSVYPLLPTPAWYSWNFWVSLDTVILTGRHFDEEPKIKAECHFCKIAQLHYFKPSPMPFVGKELDRLGLGSRWDQLRNPTVPSPATRAPRG